MSYVCTWAEARGFAHAKSWLILMGLGEKALVWPNRSAKVAMPRRPPTALLEPPSRLLEPPGGATLPLRASRPSPSRFM